MKDKIMHASFQADKLALMVSDCPPERPSTNGNSVSLSLNLLMLHPSIETFTALAEGGTVTMELQDTFWGARFGMTIDKFGINWMFNHDKEPKQNNDYGRKLLLEKAEVEGIRFYEVYRREGGYRSVEKALKMSAGRYRGRGEEKRLAWTWRCRFSYWNEMEFSCKT